MADLAAEFEAERDHLLAAAYRMLGSRAEAEDAVQETWLRFARAMAEPGARAGIRDLRAWLTTAVGRICLDVLRSARVRREAYPGSWLPEPIVTRLADPAPDPAEQAAQREQVGYALLVVLERLTPEQRVAFVLHDVFGVPFDEIAEALGSTPAAARQLASRARRAVADGAPKHQPDLPEQRRVLEAFMAATRTGDLDGLLAVLAPEVVMVGDGGGATPAARTPVRGAVQVARFLLGLARRYQREASGLVVEEVLVNGSLGLLMELTTPNDGTVRSVFAFEVEEGLVTQVFSQVNPAKLGRVPPARGEPVPPEPDR